MNVLLIVLFTVITFVLMTNDPRSQHVNTQQSAWGKTLVSSDHGKNSDSSDQLL
ncbi:ABZJ_00068 family colistin stress protein [Acinetobacter sp. WZC-1]|uniref:ABZJ_00068 family colistin stress protein n=1 Tax=Acinetobacter sp. WZC-1 TaxID=3459034 RepID=UPI00403DCD4C